MRPFVLREPEGHLRIDEPVQRELARFPRHGFGGAHLGEELFQPGAHLIEIWLVDGRGRSVEQFGLLALVEKISGLGSRHYDSDRLENESANLAGGPWRRRGARTRYPHSRKSGALSVVDLRHLADGEGERVGDFGDVVDLAEQQLPAFAGFEVFVDDLITTNVKVPDRLRHRRELLRRVDGDGLLGLRIAYEVDRVITFAVISGQAAALEIAQEMRFDQRPAEAICAKASANSTSVSSWKTWSRKTS